MCVLCSSFIQGWFYVSFQQFPGETESPAVRAHWTQTTVLTTKLRILREKTEICHRTTSCPGQMEIAGTILWFEAAGGPHLVHTPMFRTKSLKAIENDRLLNRIAFPEKSFEILLVFCLFCLRCCFFEISFLCVTALAVLELNL